MALHEGAETDQGHAVLAVQRVGDFFENGVENTIGLILGEIGLLGDGGGEFRFTHRCLCDGLLFLCPCCSSRTAPKAPQQLCAAADLGEDGMPQRPAPVLSDSFDLQAEGGSDRRPAVHAKTGGSSRFSASFSCTAAPVSA